MWLRTFLFLTLLSIAYSDCVIITLEDGPPSDAVAAGYAQPAMWGQSWTGPPACPDFQYVPSCCTDTLNSIQSDNFQKLQTAFGNQGGGCDLCAANLERFFCYYSCSPNQSDFMTFGGYKMVEVIDDTTNLPTMLNVSIVNVSVNADLACDIYQSCSKISFLTEISAGNSALGFITFLFDRGTTTSYTKDYTSIVNDGGLNFLTPAHRCNESYPSGYDPLGYPVPGNCSCNFCSDSCAPLELISYGSVTDGFKSNNVILAYLFAVVLTVGCYFIKNFRKKRSAVSQSRSLQRHLLESNGNSAS